jgi:hypothetical protein
MPLIFDRHDVDRWFAGEIGAETLEAAPTVALRMWPVSRGLNRTFGGADRASLIDEVALPT